MFEKKTLVKNLRNGKNTTFLPRKKEARKGEKERERERAFKY